MYSGKSGKIIIQIIFTALFREAFKKNVTNVTLGGGLAGQNVTFYKVVFKIHFKPF